MLINIKGANVRVIRHLIGMKELFLRILISSLDILISIDLSKFYFLCLSRAFLFLTLRLLGFLVCLDFFLCPLFRSFLLQILFYPNLKFNNGYLLCHFSLLAGKHLGCIFLDCFRSFSLGNSSLQISCKIILSSGFFFIRRR